MSLDHTARLGLPYLAAGQMQKHVTLNEALTRLDALVQCAVASRSQAESPADPPNGLMHILPAGAASGDWNDAAPGALVRADSGQWFAVGPAPGLVAWIVDEGALAVWTGETWIDLGGGLGESLPLLGVNTTADETNRFAARLNTALWTALTEADGGTGDLRYVMNKEGAADVLSLLLQSGFEGRAELGLVGDDDLRLKVSADGAAWRDALIVARDTGRVSFPQGSGRSEVTVLESSAPWVTPKWARRVRVILTAGGGGGGGGAGGPGSTSRFGGGRSDAEWDASVLGEEIQVSIGGGGSGGQGAVGAASGQGGGDGGDSRIEADGHSLLFAAGGNGGSGGSTASGSGGAGGFGSTRSNAGGSASTSGNGGGGVYGSRLDGPAGGAAGGSLETSTMARNGGLGGIGYFIGGPDSRASGGIVGSVGAAGGDGESADAGELALAGGGGGGGGAALSGSGLAGGAGGDPGAGGGGGGAGPSGGGAGGAGGGGRAVIVAWG